MSDKSDIDFHLEGEAPKSPHLIFYLGSGMAQAIPEGAMVGIVNKPHIFDKRMKMILLRVHNDYLLFKCTCNPQCSAQWKYTMEARGSHGG